MLPSNTKGSLKKPIQKPVNYITDPTDTVSAVLEMRQFKKDAIEGINKKLNEVDQIVKDKVNSLQDASDALDSAKSQIVDAAEKIKQINKGNDGKDSNEDSIANKVLAKIPKPQEIDVKGLTSDILSKVPKIDTDSLTKTILKAIPGNKASLKVIQETFEVDPMSVIEKIMALPATKLAKFKLKKENIDGLEQTMATFSNQLGRGYLHGGGDTIAAGTNITLVKNANGTTTINASGGGSGGLVVGTTTITGATNGQVLYNNNGVLGVDNVAPISSADVTGALGYTPIAAISAGTNVTITGAGTTGSPYVINSSSGSSAWNAITNPTGNQALTMGADTTAWTWGTATGTSVNPFSIIDGTNNTGTGNLVQISTASGSTLNPFGVFAQGTSNGINLLASGQIILSPVNAASQSGVLISSAPFTGGSTSTTYPLFYISPTGATNPTFSTSGTMFAINAPSGFGGVVATFGVNGNNNLVISSTGNVTSSAGTFSLAGLAVSNATNNIYISGSGAGAALISGASASAGWQYAGSTSAQGRVVINGQTSTTLTTATNYGGFIVGAMPVSTPATGSIPWISNAVVNSLGTITNGGVTPTNTASLYVGAASAAGTNNYSIYNAGNEVIAGNGALSNAALTISGTPVTSGGSGTTTFPLVYINNGTAPTTFSTSGTILGLNSPASFAGNLIDARVNGASPIFTVNQFGLTTNSVTATNPAFNLYLPSSNGSAATTQAGLQFGGSTTVTTRISTGATATAATPATGTNFGSFIVGSTPSSIVATGSNTWFANAVINPLGTITALGAGTLTNSATLYVGAATAGATNSYALYVNGSASYAGSSSGVFTEKAAATTTSYTFIWPSAQGVTGSVLTNSDGAGTGAWVATLGKYFHTIFTPTTGTTVNLVDNQYNIINPSGALLALTLNLPSSPANNDVVYIKFTQTISTVTYTGGTVVDGITAPTAGGLTLLVYDSATTSWY